jgi:hypothetical protein
MGRPRSRGNKDLPTGLYRDPASGMFYTKRKGIQQTLETKDKKTALALFAQARVRWDQEDFDVKVARVATRLHRVVRAGSDGPVFTDYCREWREKVLPSLLHRRTKRPLGMSTRADYARMLRNKIEPSELLSIPITDITSKLLRSFLSPWFMSSPSYYNNLVAILANVFRHAYRTGKITENPMKDVETDDEPKRDVYVPDNDYVAIINQLPEESTERCARSP